MLGQASSATTKRVAWLRATVIATLIAGCGFAVVLGAPESAGAQGFSFGGGGERGGFGGGGFGMR
ncbi:MAG: hypothetical protein ACHQAY_28005, partial [Hyphomicrobiales bacterium]